MAETAFRAQAATGADVVTCGVRVGEQEHLLSGDPGGLGVLSNDYGKIALIRLGLGDQATGEWPLLARLSVTARASFRSRFPLRARIAVRRSRSLPPRRPTHVAAFQGAFAIEFCVHSPALRPGLRHKRSAGPCRGSHLPTTDLAEAGTLRITIVTSQLLGFDRVGGAGTATTFLALTLARSGRDVDILYVGSGAGDAPAGEWAAL